MVVLTICDRTYVRYSLLILDCMLNISLDAGSFWMNIYECWDHIAILVSYEFTILFYVFLEYNLIVMGIQFCCLYYFKSHNWIAFLTTIFLTVPMRHLKQWLNNCATGYSAMVCRIDFRTEQIFMWRTDSCCGSQYLCMWILCLQTHPRQIIYS